MENSFLKDAINRIVELATPFTLETRNGHQFCSADLREVKPEVELPARYSVDTLEALVKLIRTEGVAQAPLLYVRVDSARRVMVDTTYTHKEYAEFSRLPLYEAVSDVPGTTTNQSMTQEQAVVEQPYRTFLEVEQPASDFLLRLDKGGRPALYEADGGAWKLEAKRNIAAYLGEQLADLVECGSVVVMI